MARPVRRSQRGKRQSFTVGDVVEIVRGDGVAPGQLLHKIGGAKSSSSDPFWLVAFDDGTRDEEISEKSFGPLLQSGGDAPTAGGAGGRGGGRRGRIRAVNNNGGGNAGEETTSGSGSPANSEEGEEDSRESTTAKSGGGGDRRRRARGGVDADAAATVVGRAKKRRQQSGGSNTSNEGETAGAKSVAKETSGASDDATASQREGDDADSIAVEDYDNDSGVNTRSSAKRKKTGGGAPGGINCRGVQGYKAGKKKSANRKGGKRHHQFHQQLYYRKQGEREHDPNETVEKVKFLTGTLFLYRGANPRAVFVRSS